MENKEFSNNLLEIDEFKKSRVGVGAPNQGGLWWLQSGGQKELYFVKSGSIVS